MDRQTQARTSASTTSNASIDSKKEDRSRSKTPSPTNNHPPTPGHQLTDQPSEQPTGASSESSYPTENSPSYRPSSKPSNSPTRTQTPSENNGKQHRSKRPFGLRYRVSSQLNPIDRPQFHPKPEHLLLPLRLCQPPATETTELKNRHIQIVLQRDLALSQVINRASSSQRPLQNLQVPLRIRLLTGLARNHRILRHLLKHPVKMKNDIVRSDHASS